MFPNNLRRGDVKMENMEENLSNRVAFTDWMYCFGALDLSLNSPQSINIPDELRELLEETKKRLERLMQHYEETSITENQFRA